MSLPTPTLSHNSKPSVAILYIATGRYTVFWDYFYQSAEKYLLPDCNKHYILFTDSDALIDSINSKSSNITAVKQEALNWPYITLLRYEIFLNSRALIERFDYTFFFNGNTEFLKTVTQQDLLPLDSKENLTFYLQPHVFHRRRNKYPYDRNSKSSAYIPYNQGKYYFAGGIVGGKTEAFLSLSEELNNNALIDLEKDIIALWHDESHLNKFALGREDIKVLPPYFTRGEREYWKKTSKLMFSDKSHYRFGGHAYLRGEADEKITQAEWNKKNARRRRKFKFRVKQYISSLFFRQ